MNRIGIVQACLDSAAHKTYLEIGVEHGLCFARIRAGTKIAVDPDREVTDEDLLDRARLRFGRAERERCEEPFGQIARPVSDAPDVLLDVSLSEGQAHLEDEQLQAAVERVTRAIVNAGGSLSKISPWGKRRLAYPIQHHRDASYFLIHFDIEPAAVRDIERGLLISEEILRHLVTVLVDHGTPVDEEIPPAAVPAGAQDGYADEADEAEEAEDADDDLEDAVSASDDEEQTEEADAAV